MNLSYQTFTPRLEAFGGLNQACYELFSSVWSQTFRELDGATDFFSDPYVYADQVGAILFQGRPIAVHISNWHDINNSLNYQLKSLAHYPDTIKSYLKSQNIQTLATMEYLCLHPEYRKSSIVNFACLMGYLSIKDIKNSEATAGITVTHNLQKVNKVCEILGMNRAPIENHILHNVPVDFYITNKSDEQRCTDPVVKELGESLYSQWNKTTSTNTAVNKPAA